LKFHPNGMKFEALDKKKKIIGIGGLIEWQFLARKLGFF
jgi:hypothetical protein